VPTYDQRGQKVNTQINIAAGLAESGGCPSCRRIDKVEKVTTIFSGGIVSGATLNESNQSLISRRLAPPEKPSTGKSCGEGLGMFGLLFLGAVGVSAGIVGTGGIIQGLYTAAEIPGPFFGFIVGLGAFYGLRLWEQALKKRTEKIITEEIPRWEKAMERWNKLYYCSRDDGVFDLSEGEFVPTQQLMKYLYR
jgi:hypothetical protein